MATHQNNTFIYQLIVITYFIFSSVFSMEKLESCCVWPILAFSISNARPILDLIWKSEIWRSFWIKKTTRMGHISKQYIYLPIHHFIYFYFLQCLQHGKVRVVLRVANSGVLDPERPSNFRLDQKKRQVTLIDPTHSKEDSKVNKLLQLLVWAQMICPN